MEERLFAVMPQEDYRRIYATVSGEDEQCAKQSARASMLRRFRTHYRKMLPLLLTHITFHAHSPEGKELLAILDRLKQSLTKRPHSITLPSRPWFFDPEWDDETIVEHDGSSSTMEAETTMPLRVARHPLELQTMLALQGALRSGTIWIEGSERYSNLTTKLLPWDESTRVSLYEKHHVPSTAQEFTTKLLALMHDALADLDRTIKRGRGVTIHNGLWAVPKIKAAPVPKHLQKLESRIIGGLGYPSITSLLADSDATLGLSETFLHYADKQTRTTKQKRCDILATLFCDAANMGFTPVRPETLQRIYVRFDLI